MFCVAVVVRVMRESICRWLWVAPADEVGGNNAPLPPFLYLCNRRVRLAEQLVAQGVSGRISYIVAGSRTVVVQQVFVVYRAVGQRQKYSGTTAGACKRCLTPLTTDVMRAPPIPRLRLPSPSPWHRGAQLAEQLTAQGVPPPEVGPARYRPPRHRHAF